MIFKWEFSFGHVVQIVAIVVGLTGMYYGLVAGQTKNSNAILENSEDIEANAEAIRRLYADRNALMQQMRTEDDRREDRIHRLVGAIKEDVSWLVRRAADDNGDDD